MSICVIGQTEITGKESPMQYKIFTYILFSVLWSTPVLAQTKVLTTLKEQGTVCQKATHLYQSNQSKIYFWCGHALVIDKVDHTTADHTNESIVQRCRADFALDVLRDQFAWNFTNIERFPPPDSYNTFEEKAFQKNGAYYLVVRQKLGKNSVKHYLNISPSSYVAAPFESFHPLERSSFVTPDYLVMRLSMTILDTPRIEGFRESGRTEEEVQKFISDVQKNGFQKYRFELENNILTRKWIRDGSVREILVIDLLRGGVPLMAKEFNRNLLSFNGAGIPPTPDDSTLMRSWDATYQEVNGVWVPRTTRTFQRMSDGTCDITEIEWSDQKINEPIPEERFSLKAIGAVRGMDVRDYRINSSYRADSDEFPWPESSAHGGLQRESILRYIFMGAGVLLLLVGGGFAWIRKRKEKTV